MVLRNARLLPSATRLRKAAFASVLSLFCLATASACESTTPDDGDGGGGPSGTVTLTQENNYTSLSELTLKVVSTAPGVDLEICWDALDWDMQCHETNPADDIDKVAMLRFRGTDYDAAEELLVAGELSMSDIDAYIQYNTTGSETCANLSDFTLVSGTRIDPAVEYTESDNQIYMLLFGTGTTPGTGARYMVFVRPIEGTDVTSVAAEPACDPDTGTGILDFSADLQGVEPADIPADGPWVIDWRDVERDSIDNEITFEFLDRVLLGFYEDTSVAELEANIFNIEIDATELWEIPIEGQRTADLRTARHQDTDEVFDGFSNYGDGTWLLAIMCSTCQNPAPVILTVLNPI